MKGGGEIDRKRQKIPLFAFFATVAPKPGMTKLPMVTYIDFAMAHSVIHLRELRLLIRCSFFVKGDFSSEAKVNLSK